MFSFSRLVASLGRGVSFPFCCPKSPLLHSGPPSRVWLTNWATWCLLLLLKSKPVRKSPSMVELLSFHLVRSTAGGEHSRTTIQGPNGPENVPNYALVQGIFIGVVAVYLIILTLIGPEKHGSHFERSKTAFQAGASKDDVNSITEDAGGVQYERSSTGSGGNEKGGVQHIENGRTPAKNDLV